jgi:protein-disulfide isomerase
METVSESITTTRKEKNLLAVAILLGGLFLGSLFVDLVQLISGEGFSPWATRNSNVLETSGKTWVGYGDPKVTLQVITDTKCADCDPSEALIWLRRVIPTVEATSVDIADPFGSELARRLGVITLPAFVFSKDILHTNFYSQASSLFEARDGYYFFDMGKIGLPVGRYLKLPTVDDRDIISGSNDAKVTIVLFSDFECPYCKTFHEKLKQAAQPFGDQVRLVYKHFPLAFHTQAENAARAAECANEQGKFDQYSTHLYTKQGEWSKTTGLQKFKDYAWWLKLEYRSFATCLESDRFKDKIVKDREEARSLSVRATPATFIGETFVDGAVETEDIKRIIEQELAR